MNPKEKKVISFSLWGSSEVYLLGALKTLEQTRHLYPDWEAWFHLGADVPAQIRYQLENNGATLKQGIEWGPWSGMYWRFLPASDPSVDIMICRDVDGEILPREVDAVHEWLESGKTLHIMRDHPKHEMPVMGGMWGCRASPLRDMKSSIVRHGKFDRYGRDQEFLANYIYPRFKFDSFIHSECVYFSGEQVRSFPRKRSGYEFIGMADRDTELINRQNRYLQEWASAGSPLLKRPHPWSILGKIRIATGGRWPGANL